MKKENRSDKPINHPGRNQLLQYFDYHCVAATPPSKGEPAPLLAGGKYYERTELRYSNPFVFIDPPCKICFRLLRLSAMPFSGLKFNTYYTKQFRRLVFFSFPCDHSGNILK